MPCHEKRRGRNGVPLSSRVVDEISKAAPRKKLRANSGAPCAPPGGRPPQWRRYASPFAYWCRPQNRPGKRFRSTNAPAGAKRHRAKKNRSPSQLAGVTPEGLASSTKRDASRRPGRMLRRCRSGPRPAEIARRRSRHSRWGRVFRPGIPVSRRGAGSLPFRTDGTARRIESVCPETSAPPRSCQALPAGCRLTRKPV